MRRVAIAVGILIAGLCAMILGSWIIIAWMEWSVSHSIVFYVLTNPISLLAVVVLVFLFLTIVNGVE